MPFEKGHRVVQESAGLARRQDRNDVRVRQASREPDLSTEPLRVDRAAQLRAQHLQCDRSAERDLRGDEEVRTPAIGELTLHRILATQGGLELCEKPRSYVRHGRR